MTHLDEVSTRFIAGSPFLLLGTSSLRGPVESHHAADPLAGSKSSELAFSLKKIYEPGACGAGDAWLSDPEKPQQPVRHRLQTQLATGEALLVAL
jgi:hypothetical protein